MKLWLISQCVNNGYDTYDSAVVAAESEEEARLIHPSQHFTYEYREGKWWIKDSWGRNLTTDNSWASIREVDVELIGDAAPGVPKGVICASFNAG